MHDIPELPEDNEPKIAPWLSEELTDATFCVLAAAGLILGACFGGWA